jgi:WD40 repeat protein
MNTLADKMSKSAASGRLHLESDEGEEVLYDQVLDSLHFWIRTGGRSLMDPSGLTYASRIVKQRDSALRGTVDTGFKQLTNLYNRRRTEQVTINTSDNENTSAIFCLVLSPNEQYVASGSQDGLIRLWNANMGTCSAILQGHTDRLICIVFSNDGQHLASGSHDYNVQLWSVDRVTGLGGHIAALEGHTDSVSSLVFSPDGRRIASGSWDGTVRLWDVDTYQCVAVLDGAISGCVLSVSYSPDGRRVAGGSTDRTVRIWDANTGELTAMLEGHLDWVRSVIFSPSGQYIASVSDDWTVKLCDTQTAECVATLQGHPNGLITSLAFSPDGRQIIAYAGAGTRIWNVETHQPVVRATYEEPRSACTSFFPTFALDEFKRWLLASELPGDGHWHAVYQIPDDDLGSQVSSWGHKAVVGTEMGRIIFVDCTALFRDPNIMFSSLPQSHFVEL